MTYAAAEGVEFVAGEMVPTFPFERRNGALVLRTYDQEGALRELPTDEGFTITPSSFATGSVYTRGEGLSIEDARNRALIEAHVWGDLMRLRVEPFVEDGETHAPSMTFDSYAMEREERAEQAARAAGKETT